jgi:hypothetical protein
MTLETLSFLAHTQTALSAIVAFLALLKFKSREPYIRLIGLAFLLSFLGNFSALILHSLGLKLYVNIPQSIYQLLIICVISLLFYHALNKRYGQWFLVITICSMTFAIISLLLIQKQFISSYHTFLDSFIIICYCVFYFYRLMVELPSTHLQRMPMFWFTSAFLIYYAGALILFIFTSYIVNVLKDNLITYWIFHNSLSICEHFIVIIGLCYDLKKNRMLYLTRVKYLT